MVKRLILASLITLNFVCAETWAQDNKMDVSFEQATQMVHSDNKSAKIANKEFEWAKSERQRMNSFWYPKVSVDGAFVHMANDVEVKQPLSDYTNPLKDYITSIDPGEKLVTGMLDKLGQRTLDVGLTPQNVTTVDAMVTMLVFTGGKRIFASRIGKLMVNASSINKEQVYANQHILLVETYFGLRLMQKIVETRELTYAAMEKHFQDALKLEAEGMINKADRLFFQVNRDEAKRELEAAHKDLFVAQNAFKTLTNLESSALGVQPTTSLFINETLPAIDHFKGLIIDQNYVVNTLKIQKQIKNNEIKIANAAYVPNIEVFGKQTLYSHGIEKNLVPRFLIGVGFSWNIFDGLDREKKIQQAKISRQILDIQQDKVEDDLSLLIDQFYTQTQNALNNVTALNTTIDMSKELVRVRQKSYLEGMATSTEVVDAELLLSKVRIASLTAYYQFDLGLINLLSVCGMPDSFNNYKENGINEDRIF